MLCRLLFCCFWFLSENCSQNIVGYDTITANWTTGDFSTIWFIQMYLILVLESVSVRNWSLNPAYKVCIPIRIGKGVSPCRTLIDLDFEADCVLLGWISSFGCSASNFFQIIVFYFFHRTNLAGKHKGWTLVGTAILLFYFVSAGAPLSAATSLSEYYEFI